MPSADRTPSGGGEPAVGGFPEPGKPEATEGSGGLRPTLFREEALDRYRREREERREPLRLSPAWLHTCYWLVVAAVAGGLLYAGIAEVREYAAGTAVVRFPGSVEVAAPAGGIVREVLVVPGDRLARGSLLLRLSDEQERAELEHVERAFELQLLERLRDPSDAAAEQALRTLRAQRELARAHLDRRRVRAPVGGVVNEVRVRPGRYLAPGEAILSIARAGDRPSVIAWFPGEALPRIRPGARMRLELDGYRYAYQELTVGRAGETVVGPLEARRFLGDEIGDAVRFDGPLALVEAPLPSPTFEADGRRYRYHDGMLGRVEVEIRSTKLLTALFPGLEGLMGVGIGWI